uniref:Uncharacterized protein n=1 Tax=Plectus sambesii TaxID=2011161 RepID=A0A914UYN4_9BILA
MPFPRVTVIRDFRALALPVRGIYTTFTAPLTQCSRTLTSSAARKTQTLTFLTENFSGASSFGIQEKCDDQPFQDQVFKYACESEEKFRRISAVVPLSGIDFNYHKLWENYYSETKETLSKIAAEQGQSLVQQGVLTSNTLDKLYSKRKLLPDYYFVGSTDSVSNIDVHNDGDKAFLDYTFEDEMAFFADYDPEVMTHDEKVSLIKERPELIDEHGGLLLCHSFCLRVVLSRQIKPVDGEYYVSKLTVV